MRSIPPNTTLHSLDPSGSSSDLAVTLRLFRAMSHLFSARKPDLIFVHMAHRLALAVAPWARLFRVPVVMWYCHHKRHAELALAHRLVHHVVTALPHSYPIRDAKVHAIGHGINTARFTPTRRAKPRRHVIAVGRLSPIKRVDLIVDAFAPLAARGWRLSLVGAGGRDTPVAYEEAVRSRLVRLKISNAVRILPAHLHRDMPGLYRRASSFINCTPLAADKAVFEAMSSGLPVVLANRAFEGVLGPAEHRVCASTDSPRDITERLTDLDADYALGMKLRTWVRDFHALERFPPKVIHLIPGKRGP